MKRRDAAAGQHGGQAGSRTIVAIWLVELVANGCGAGRGVRIIGARRLTGLFSHALPGTLTVLSRPA